MSDYGNVQWIKRYGIRNTLPDSFTEVVEANDGGFVIVGNKIEEREFYFYDDFWIMKVDENGDEEWSLEIGQNDRYDKANDIIKLSDGSYIATGWSFIDDGIAAMRLVRVSSDGNIIWNKLAGGNGWYDIGTSLAVNNNETVFVGCDHQKEDQESVIAEVEVQLDKPGLSKEEIAFLTQRLVILKGVVAVLSIGAHTESSLLELVDRIDDALHATKSAMESGFLPGGGTALLRAGVGLQDKASDDDRTILGKSIAKIYAESCMAPLKQILNNADLRTDYIVEKILEGKMKKYFSEVTLLNQAYILDQDKTVRDIINQYSKYEYELISFDLINL